MNEVFKEWLLTMVSLGSFQRELGPLTKTAREMAIDRIKAEGSIDCIHYDETKDQFYEQYTDRTGKTWEPEYFEQDGYPIYQVLQVWRASRISKLKLLDELEAQLRKAGVSIEVPESLRRDFSFTYDELTNATPWPLEYQSSYCGDYDY